MFQVMSVSSIFFFLLNEKVANFFLIHEHMSRLDVVWREGREGPGQHYARIRSTGAGQIWRSHHLN